VQGLGQPAKVAAAAAARGMPGAWAAAEGAGQGVGVQGGVASGRCAQEAENVREQRERGVRAATLREWRERIEGEWRTTAAAGKARRARDA
jgi:hypothetical protein